MRYRGSVRPAIRRGSIREFFGSYPNLKGCWSLDGNMRDESGNANHGTISGNVVPYIGKFGNSYLFDGSSGYIYAVDSPSLDIIDAITLGAWVKPDTLNAYHPIIGKTSTDTIVDYLLRIYDGLHLQFVFYNGGYYYLNDTTTSIRSNIWTYVAVTYDKQYIKIYVNGNIINQKSTTQAMLPSAASLYIGYHLSVVGNQYWKGLISETVVFNRALSPAEISQYYQWATATPRKYWLYSPEIVAAGNLLVHPGYDGGYRKHRGGYR